MKHAGKAAALGICLGVALVAVQKSAGVDSDTFLHWYWIAALVIIVIWMFRYASRHK